MAVKTAVPVKKPAVNKAVAAKKAAPAKKAAVRKSIKGKELECYVCGLVVTIDEDCGCIEEHAIICCEEPMKAPRKAAAKKVIAKKK